MSFSTMCFSPTEMDDFIVRNINVDTCDLDSYVKGDYSQFLDISNAVLKDSKRVVFDRNKNKCDAKIDTFIHQIVLIEVIPLNSIMTETYAFVSYHHSCDPSLYEVMMECGRIFMKMKLCF